jgi:DNA-binding NtrC family response regulator
VLEDRKLRRLGSKAETPVDVRVIAATNKDPQQAVASGQLRGDLFYRLNVFNIHMPPLREHASDIPAIAAKMVDDMNQRHNCSITGVAPDLLSRLVAYDWPGNARELRNTIERATILAGTGQLQVEHLPPNFGEAGYATRLAPAATSEAPAASTPPERDDDRTVRVEVGTTVDEAERQLILKTLLSTHNNKTRAAEILGITPKTLQNKLKEYSSAAASANAAAAIDAPVAAE